MIFNKTRTVWCKAVLVNRGGFADLWQSLTARLDGTAFRADPVLLVQYRDSLRKKAAEHKHVHTGLQTGRNRSPTGSDQWSSHELIARITSTACNDHTLCAVTTRTLSVLRVASVPEVIHVFRSKLLLRLHMILHQVQYSLGVKAAGLEHGTGTRVSKR